MRLRSTTLRSAILCFSDRCSIALLHFQANSSTSCQSHEPVMFDISEMFCTSPHRETALHHGHGVPMVGQQK